LKIIKHRSNLDVLVRAGCWSMEQTGSKRHWLWKYQRFQEQIRRNPEDKDSLLYGLVPPSLTASLDQGNSDPRVATPGKWPSKFAKQRYCCKCNTAYRRTEICTAI